MWIKEKIGGKLGRRAVAIEGIDFSGKSFTARELAKLLGGRRIKTPSKNLEPLRRRFENSLQLRFLYFLLGALMPMESNGGLIVLDRSWVSTLATHKVILGKDLRKLFKMMAENLGWERDFLFIDLVVLLKVEDERELRRRQRERGVKRFEELEILKAMAESFLEVIRWVKEEGYIGEVVEWDTSKYAGKPEEMVNDLVKENRKRFVLSLFPGLPEEIEVEWERIEEHKLSRFLISSPSHLPFREVLNGEDGWKAIYEVREMKRIFKAK